MQPEPKVNVLLVDDHPENLLALEAILEGLGQHLVKAHSGEEALRCLLHQDFAVILLDVQMPGMDGFETATLIRNRARSQHTPIIFLTAFSTSETLMFKGYSLGAVDYLFKPVEAEVLTSKVGVFVDLFKKTEEVKRQAAQLAAVNTELRESEERFRSLSACSPVGIFLTDIEGRGTYTNPRCQAICGFTLEESLGDGWLNSVYPEDRQKVFAQWSETTREGRSYSDELRLQTKEGSIRWVHVRSSPMFSDQGELIGHVGTVEDITERKQALDRLTESENRWRTIIEAEPECVKLVASDGTLLDMNAAGLAMIEAESANAAIGQSVYSLITPEHQEAFVALNESVCQGSRGRLEFEIIGLNGTRRWMETHAVPLRSESDGTLVQLAISRDITARKQADAALEQAKQELEIRVEERTAQLRTANEQLLMEIAERQRVQEELERSLSILRGTLEATADGIIVS